MKILFLTDSFPPKSFGGAGIVAFNLAKGLLDKGHEVSIITTIQKKSEEGKIKLQNLNIFRIYSNYHSRWQAWLSLYNYRTIFRVEKIIQDIRPDIIHVHNIHKHLSYHCLKIAKKYAKAVFLTAHDAMLVCCGKPILKNGNCFYKISAWDQLKETRKRYNPFRNIVIKHYLKYVDKIFAVSDSLKEFLRINKIKNIERIYNGIDIDGWGVNPEQIKIFKEKHGLCGKKIIFFGGRLSGAKGGEVILKAMALVIKSEGESVLLVAGEKDDYAQKMVGLAKRLGIDNNIKFTGWLDRETMKLAFFASDVCVTPSIYLDPFNLLNIEAGAAKKPVVGTCFGGTAEIIINNKTGYIVNPLDTEIMAEKILDLLKNPERARKFGEAGYKRVKENFSLEKQIEETLKYYRKFIN